MDIKHPGHCQDTSFNLPFSNFQSTLTHPQPFQHSLGVQQHLPKQAPCTGSTLYIHSVSFGMYFISAFRNHPAQPTTSGLFLYRNKGIMEDTTNEHRYCTYSVNKTPLLLMYDQISKRNSVNSVHFPSPIEVTASFPLQVPHSSLKEGEGSVAQLYLQGSM